MKQLLALTDFSANAAHAAETALRLCAKLNTSLLLHHSMQFVSVVPVDSYGTYASDNAEMLCDESIGKLKEACRSLQSIADEMTGYRPELSFANAKGPLAENIRSISGQTDISLVVMGAGSGGAIDHLLSGSETIAVIRNCRKPILIIPETTSLNALKKVVFATDFSAADIIALAFLMDLAQRLSFRIEVIHFLHPDDAANKIEAEMTFREYLDSLDQEIISYQQIFSNHKVQRLQEYAEETGASVLAITPGQHDWISRLLVGGVTKKIIAHQHIAVLIFPTGFTQRQSVSHDTYS
jgi:nucleotide-binding universal stress UspA family protein